MGSRPYIKWFVLWEAIRWKAISITTLRLAKGKRRPGSTIQHEPHVLRIVSIIICRCGPYCIVDLKRQKKPQPDRVDLLCLLNKSWKRLVKNTHLKTTIRQNTSWVISYHPGSVLYALYSTLPEWCGYQEGHMYALYQTLPEWYWVSRKCYGV